MPAREFPWRTGCALLLGLAAGAAWGADGGIGGPVSGFIAEGRGNSIRAIEGLPGAARLGARVPLPFGVASAAIASRLDFALAIPAGGGAPVLVRGLRTATPQTVALDGAITPSTMALAQSGAAAILYSAAGRQLQFVTGLPLSPRAIDAIDSVDAASLALDDAGTAAVFASADGRIFAVHAGERTPREVATLAGAAHVAMLPGRDAAVAAGGNGKIILIDGLDGAGTIRTLAGAGSEVVSPRSIAALDADTVGVIAGDGRLAALDVRTGAVEWIALAGAAERFEALDSGLFALNRPGLGPLLLFDALHGRAAWFVPPDRLPATQRGPSKSGIGGKIGPEAIDPMEDRPLLEH